MFKKNRARIRPLQHGIQKRKVRSRSNVDAKGIFDSLEQLIPPEYRPKLYKFAENCFLFYTRMCCTLCLIPMTLPSNNEALIAKVSAKKQLLNYAVLSLLVLGMTHKFVMLFHYIISVGLDMTAFFIAATFLCYLVSLSISSSVLFLPGETIDLVNGCHKILAICFQDDDDDEKVGAEDVFADTNTAVVVTSLCIVAVVIGTAISVGTGLEFPDLPVSFYSMARQVNLISETSETPRFIWLLLLWPLELAQYMLPAFRSGWAASVMSALIMVAIRCTEQLRCGTYLLCHVARGHEGNSYE